MTSGPPSDQEVAICLEEGLRRRGQETAVTAIERAPYAYATSFPLEEVVARLDDGRTLRLILKDLTWERLLGQARRTKPAFLYDPRRCIDVYRDILAGTGMGPRFYGATSDDQRGRYWLLIEKVEGVELWQIGEFSTWEATARWLARFHQRFVDGADELAGHHPSLLRYGPEFLRSWPARALDVAGRRGVSVDERAGLERISAQYDGVIERLMKVPATFVHGELYPSNVLVDDAGSEVKVWPIDWEMAGVGPPFLDLAALTAGWDEPEKAKLVDAYLDELGPDRWFGDQEVTTVLDCCRLHYALQWLGWSPDWSPPAEHARNWMAEALEVSERLGL
jgi:hypothetical protein